MTTPAPIRRILLALDTGNDNAALFEAALALAAHLDAELAALFVEDEELLRLAALPFARELGSSSALRRPLRDQDMQRTLHRRAARSQAALAAAATHVQVRWSFRVTRGRVVSCIAEAAMESDLVTLSLGSDPLLWARDRILLQRTLAASLRPVLLLPPGAGLRAPYVVVFDGSEAALRTLQLAARLGGRERRAVRVWLVPAADQAGALRSAAEALLAETGTPGEFRILPALTAGDMVRAARREAAGTLLLPAHGGLPDPERVGRLAGELGCATLLVP